MGIFERLIDAFETGMNEFADKSENTDKTVKQIIGDLQKELNDTTQRYKKIKKAKSFIDKKYREALSASELLSRRARKALSEADRELAKKALAEKLKADEDAAGYKEVYETISEISSSLMKRVGILKKKIQEAENEEAILAAKSQAADVMKEIAKNIVEFDVPDSVDRFKRTEESAPEEHRTDIPEDNKNGNNSGTIVDEILDIDSEIEKLMAEIKGEDIDSDDEDV